jgi:hypothetical protein
MNLIRGRLASSGGQLSSDPIRSEGSPAAAAPAAGERRRKREKSVFDFEVGEFGLLLLLLPLMHGDRRDSGWGNLWGRAQ